MKLIVGLGNPGREYEATRHNLGFMVIDRLAERAGARRFRDEAGAKVAEALIAGERAMLVKPQTYMNLSGNAVRPLLEKYGGGQPSELIVVVDDVALASGIIRVRARGSAGGQKGLKSIIEHLGTEGFARVRLGIKPDHPVSDLPAFVLSDIPRRERASLDEMLDRASDAVEAILAEGVERAMSRFNERQKMAAADDGPAD
jgi:PTH1 family peptidyl-tRNA hydrolase